MPPPSAPRRAKARASRREPALRTLTEPRSVKLRCGLVTRSDDAAGAAATGGGGGTAVAAGAASRDGGGGGGGGGGAPPGP